MSCYEKKSSMPVSARDLFDWHARPGAFQRLTPPWENIRVLEQVGGIRDGARLVMEIQQGPMSMRWVAHHRDYQEGEQFVDEQVEGPFSHWVHRHQFVPEGERSSTLLDHVDYALPLGAAGRVAGGPFTKKMLERMFDHRHERTRQDLERHQRFADRGTWRIAITGTSGLIGTQLAAFLEGGGHTVERLVRREAREGEPEIRWNPATGEVDEGRIDGVDAVVHLAGENIASGRWTDERKQQIRESRVEGTKKLCESLARLEKKPKVVVVASAIGYYGARGDEILTESSAPGEGFLPDVCRAWEDAAEPAAQAGIRVVHPRIGIVLAAQGGALAKMLPAFKMGVGGRVGRGTQYMSWVSLDDMVGILQHLLLTESLSGPVNAVAPTPVTNAVFTKALGRVLKRPTFLPVPATAIKVLFGEMGEKLVLQGARVVPNKLQESGFGFLHEEIESALRAELGLR